MDSITTTNLRTQSSKLVDTLNKGGEVSLIHLSKIVGIIKPQKEPNALTKTDINELKNLAKNLYLPNIPYKERENI